MAVERLTAVVGARISEFKRKMAEVNAIARNAAREIRTEVDARTEPFQRAMARVRAQIAMINGRTIWVNIRARTDRFQNEMEELASVIRTFGTVGQNMIGGGLLTFFPMLVPIIAGVTGALATAGVALGVMGGGLLALMSSFSLAALGGLAFTGAMIPTIQNIKNARAEINEGRRALESYSKPMQYAITMLDKMSGNFLYLNEAIEPYVLMAMGNAMETVVDLMRILQPGIVAVAQAFQGLMEKMRHVVNNAPDMKANFAWFNERAASAVTAWGEIAGYALRGFLNLMRAFDPLAKTTEQGLLNMTKRFSEWAAGLSKSDKFKAFMDYVRVNGPKLTSIFGNIVTGLVNLFVAFGPLAADMLTGFQKLTARFKEWSAALGENKQFQEFIQYIRDNGPGVISLIGNLITFLVNVGIAMAPIGSFLLDIANRFLEWASNMRVAHPVLSTIIAGFFSFIGVVQMFLPLFLLWRAAFGGAFSWIMTKFAPFRTMIITGLRMVGSKLLSLGLQIGKFALQAMMWLGKLLGRAVIWAVRMAAQWLIAMGPIGWIIIAVVALVALIIWKWDEIKAWTIKIWNAVWTWIKDTWQKIWDKTKEVATSIWTTIKEKFQAIKDAISEKMTAAKAKLQEIWSSIKTAVVNKATELWNSIKEKFESIKQAISDKTNAAKDKIQEIWSNIKTAISNKAKEIWNDIKDKFESIKQSMGEKMNAAKDKVSEVWTNIKTAISDKAREIWNTVKEKFQAVVDAVRDKLQAAYDKVVEIWDSVVSFLEGIDLASIGSDIIQGLINGVKSMASSLVDSVSGVVGDAIQGAKNLLKINSPSRVFMEMGAYTGEGFAIGMKDTMRTVARASNAMIGSAMPNLSPLEVATPASNAVYTPQVNMPEIKTASGEEGRSAQPANITLQLGRNEFRTYVDDITRQQKEQEYRLRREAGE